MPFKGILLFLPALGCSTFFFKFDKFCEYLIYAGMTE